MLLAKKDFPSPVGAKMAKFRALMRFFFSSQTSFRTGMLCSRSLKMIPVLSAFVIGIIDEQAKRVF